MGLVLLHRRYYMIRISAFHFRWGKLCKEIIIFIHHFKISFCALFFAPYLFIYFIYSFTFPPFTSYFQSFSIVSPQYIEYIPNKSPENKNKKEQTEKKFFSFPI